MNDRFASQSFLGPESDAIFADVTVGIVGLSGGGSHIVQQLAHVGVGRYVVVDYDRAEARNLNRLVGGTVEDVAASRLKTEIAERVIRNVNPEAEVIARPVRWQEAMPELRGCDVLFGCVDRFNERAQLERVARRFLIPYIDLGMDIHPAASGFSLSGQVVLSSPGGPCLWCLGILTEGRLAEEAKKYGRAGSRPQVIWPNGVLASLGIGLFVQLPCPWHGAAQLTACCEFDGDHHRVETSRMEYAEQLRCRHFPADEVGDQFFARRE